MSDVILNNTDLPLSAEGPYKKKKHLAFVSPVKVAKGEHFSFTFFGD